MHNGAVIVDLTIWFSDDDSCWLSRRIVEQARRAEHRNLYLPSNLQGRGEARELWKRELQLYEDLGCIDTVWVESERIGRYANIRSGVEFRDGRERGKVVEAIQAVAAKLQIPFDVSQLKDPWDVIAIPNRTSRAAAEAAGVSLDPEATFASDTSIPLGKLALLSDLCEPWVGRIDLDAEAKSYRRLRDYIGP